MMLAGLLFFPVILSVAQAGVLSPDSAAETPSIDADSAFLPPEGEPSQADLANRETEEPLDFSDPLLSQDFLTNDALLDSGRTQTLLPDENWTIVSGAPPDKGAAAIDVLRAYVNVVGDGGSGAGSDGASGGGTSGDGGNEAPGFLMSMANGLGRDTVTDLVTDVLRPQMNGSAVTFSLFGFGDFLLVGERGSGALSMINLNNGQAFDIRSAAPPSPDRTAGRRETPAPAAGVLADNFDGDGNFLVRAVHFLLDLATNPLSFITYFCVLAIWLLWRVLKKFA
jgi:hypothetical protein